MGSGRGIHAKVLFSNVMSVNNAIAVLDLGEVIVGSRHDRDEDAVVTTVEILQREGRPGEEKREGPEEERGKGCREDLAAIIHFSRLYQFGSLGLAATFHTSPITREDCTAVETVGLPCPV